MLLVLACYFSITFSVTLFELPSTTAAGELSSTVVNTGIQIMNVLWGILLGVISLIAWLGQAQPCSAVGSVSASLKT
jgi:uncharacterized membrane protein